VFCYDEQNRLVWAGSTGTPSCGASLTPGSLSSANYTQAFTYDTLDRLTSGPLGSYTYGDSAHLHAVTSIGSGPTYTATYDAVGDMTCRAPDNTTTCSSTPTGAQLGYDNEGRLATWQNAPSSPTTTDSFLYDGEGQRVEQQVTINGSMTTTSTYVAGGLEEISDNGTGGTLTKYFTGANGLPTAERVGTGGLLSYLATDGQGTVSESLDSAGNVTSSQLYTSYGNTRYSSGSSPTTLGYTGQRADSMPGLDYYHARYYDPVAGQFVSADTVADGLNRYGYVHGNPTTATDPSGHFIDSGSHLGGSSSGDINESDWVWYPKLRKGDAQKNMRQQIANCRVDTTGCGRWSADVFGYTPFDNRGFLEQKHRLGLDDPDWDAAVVLEHYFGLTVMLNTQSPRKDGKNPDYTMGMATMTGLPAWPGIGWTIQHGTNMELYSPISPSKKNVTNEILRKGASGGMEAQAPIVVVDVSHSSVFNGMGTASLTAYGQSLIGSAGPYRIIFIRDGVVQADVGNWGPDAYGDGSIA
jgi:RHS repeat-associated protein